MRSTSWRPRGRVLSRRNQEPAGRLFGDARDLVVERPRAGNHDRQPVIVAIPKRKSSAPCFRRGCRQGNRCLHRTFRLLLGPGLQLDLKGTAAHRTVCVIKQPAISRVAPVSWRRSRPECPGSRGLRKGFTDRPTPVVSQAMDQAGSGHASAIGRSATIFSNTPRRRAGYQAGFGDARATVRTSNACRLPRANRVIQGHRESSSGGGRNSNCWNRSACSDTPRLQISEHTLGCPRLQHVRRRSA